MLTDFLTMDDIETDIEATFKVIRRRIDRADDDTIISMMAIVSRLLCAVAQFGCETDEWSLFELLEQYQDGLKKVFDNLSSRLLTS